MLPVAVGGLLLLGGCASIETVKEARGQGIKVLYRYSYDDVYAAALIAAQEQELGIVETKKDKGRILLSHGMTQWSWGERIAVFLTKVSDRATEVEIVSKPIAPLSFPPDWVNRLFDGIDQVLKAPE